MLMMDGLKHRLETDLSETQTGDRPLLATMETKLSETDFDGKPSTLTVAIFIMDGL